MRSKVPLGRMFGIPVGLDYSWFLVFILFTWMLAVGYFPAQYKSWPPSLYWIVSAVTTIMLFVSVLLHELGHSLMARHYRLKVRSITLFIFGGVAEIATEPPNAKVEFWVAIAGPLVSLALAGLFYVLEPLVAGWEPVLATFKYLALINFVLAIFNLVPGFPLDGGRVFRALVWAHTKDLRRATVTAGSVGRFFGYFFIMIGVWFLLLGDLFNGLWIAFIGWFLETAAVAQIQQVRLNTMLSGHRVSEAMSRHFATVDAATPLDEVVHTHILGAGRRTLIVERDGQIAGLLTLDRVKHVPREAWAATTAGEAMIPLEKLKTIRPDAGLWSALQEMDRDGVNQLPVLDGDRLVGVLSREDVINYLRTLVELSELRS